MKDSYQRVSLSRLCRLLGVTRQAFYQHFWFNEDLSVEHQLILQQVRDIRRLHPAIGGRKIHYMLQPFLTEHQIKIGRDGLFDLLAENRLLVRKKRRHIKTTYSYHMFKKYPNLIKEWKPSAPGQLWVADITYVAATQGFLYLSLITDAYSHKIVGFNIAGNMHAINTVKAMQMALKQHPNPKELIHHSDRGIQYCCHDYVSLLNKHNIKISMTQSGDPLENPLAERINGILKQEYLNHFVLGSLAVAQRIVQDAVDRYNNSRPHLSINYLTPAIVHQSNLLVNRTWSKPYQKRNIVTESLI